MLILFTNAKFRTAAHFLLGDLTQGPLRLAFNFWCWFLKVKASITIIIFLLMRVCFTLSSSVKYQFSWLPYKCPPKMSFQNGIFAWERMGVNQVEAISPKSGSWLPLLKWIFDSLVVLVLALALNMRLSFVELMNIFMELMTAFIYFIVCLSLFLN